MVFALSSLYSLAMIVFLLNVTLCSRNELTPIEIMERMEVRLVVAQFLAQAINEREVALTDVLNNGLDVFDVQEDHGTNRRVLLKQKIPDAMNEPIDE